MADGASLRNQPQAQVMLDQSMTRHEPNQAGVRVDKLQLTQLMSYHQETYHWVWINVWNQDEILKFKGTKTLQKFLKEQILCYNIIV